MKWQQAAQQLAISLVGGIVLIAAAAAWERVAAGGLIGLLGGATAKELAATNARVSVLANRPIPLPSPISLGGVSRFTTALGLGSASWTPLPAHEEVTIDWQSIPDNIEVYAYAYVRLTTRTRSQPIYGHVRVVDVSLGQPVATFDSVQATVDEPSTPVPTEERGSTPLPRQNGASIYRLEVSGDSGGTMSAYGYLRFRRQGSVDR